MVMAIGIGTTSLAGPPTQPAPLAGELRHRYDFEQNDATDSMGTSHGKAVGRVGFVAGRVGNKAVLFDGQGQIDLPALDLGETFTITLWIKPDWDDGNNIQPFLASASEDKRAIRFHLDINSFHTSDWKLAMDTNSRRAGSRAEAINPGVWNAIAVTVDLHNSPPGTNAKDQARLRTARFFVNGVEVTTDNSILRATTSQVLLTIGRIDGTAHRYRGVLDDLRIYSGLLTPVEIAALAQAPAQGADKSDVTPIMQVPPADKILATLRKGHPRLFMTSERLAQLKEKLKHDATTQAWYVILQKDADAALAATDLPQYAVKGSLETSRKTLRRVANLGMMYQLTADRRYADRAWKDLEAAAAFADWVPSNWLATAEMTAACAVGYDWLYDVWTDEQRATLRRALVDKGLQPALDTYENRQKWGWYRVTFNWNQVCNGGVGLAALAVAEDEPKLAGQVLRYGLLSLPRAMVQFAPDGASPETPSYWMYANLYSTLFMAGLDDALGTDFGLSKIEGVSAVGNFPQYVMGPLGQCFNYNDSHPWPVEGPQMFWLAAHFQNSGWARYQLPWVKPQPDGHDLLPMSMLWYDPVLAGKPVATAPLDRYFRKTELVTFRSAWEDANAAFLAFKTGDNDANHSHLCAGEFIFDALGARWAMDVGAGDYNLPGYFDMSNARWNYYCTRAQGHNTLVINPDRTPDQDLHARMIINRFVPNPQTPFTITDLTPAYARDAQQVMRGFALLDRRQALIQDELKLKQPGEVWWFMHTSAQVTVSEDGQSATLRKRGKTLIARLLSSSLGGRFTVMDAVPLPGTPTPKQDANKDIRKLAIHLSGVSEGRIAVLLTPLADEAAVPPAPPKIVPLAKW